MYDHKEGKIKGGIKMDVNNVAQAIANAAGLTDVQKIKEKENGSVEVEFYTQDLKIGGYDDIDSNGGERLEEIEYAVRTLMGSKYNNIKYTISDTEKGYWMITLEE